MVILTLPSIWWFIKCFYSHYLIWFSYQSCGVVVLFPCNRFYQLLGHQLIKKIRFSKFLLPQIFKRLSGILIYEKTKQNYSAHNIINHFPYDNVHPVRYCQMPPYIWRIISTSTKTSQRFTNFPPNTKALQQYEPFLPNSVFIYKAFSLRWSMSPHANVLLAGLPCPFVRQGNRAQGISKFQDWTQFRSKTGHAFLYLN